MHCELRCGSECSKEAATVVSFSDQAQADASHIQSKPRENITQTPGDCSSNSMTNFEFIHQISTLYCLCTKNEKSPVCLVTARCWFCGLGFLSSANTVKQPPSISNHAQQTKHTLVFSQTNVRKMHIVIINLLIIYVSFLLHTHEHGNS